MHIYKKHTHTLSFSYQTRTADTVPFNLTSNLFFSMALCLINYGQAVWPECFSLSVGPGLLESGSIAVSVILQHRHRRSNRKSIKAPMNQHSWPAPLGQYATLTINPAFHCLSPSLNPMSGKEHKRPILQTGPFNSPSIYVFGLSLSKMPI